MLIKVGILAVVWLVVIDTDDNFRGEFDFLNGLVRFV